MTTQPLTQIEPVWNVLAAIKAKAPSAHSNLFAAGDEIQSWINSHCATYQQGEGAFLLFRHQPDFCQVYHVAACSEALSRQLVSLDRDSGMVLVCDLIGKPEHIAPYSQAYRDNGFDELRTLIRMTAPSGSAAHYGLEDNKVMFAEPNQFPAVAGFLARMLHPFADRIPSAGELQAALSRRQVLVATDGTNIDGLLFFERQGLTATIRYWYVGEDCRDRGVGSRLMRTFLSLCRDARRIILWVVRTNSDAIAKYRRYGFVQEGLIDQILTRGTP